MKRHQLLTIILKVIGFVALAWGLLVIIPSMKMYYWQIKGGDLVRDFSMPDLINVAMMLLFVCITISGYGILFIKPWARKFAIGVFGIDFLTRLTDAIYFWTYYLRHPEHKQLLAQLMKQVANEPEKYHLIVRSMIPSYIEGILALSIVIFMMSRPIKEYYISIEPVEQTAINS